jgi:hypothetical protein
MTLSTASYKEIAEFFIAEWTRRSESDLVKAHGKGCFVWDSEKDSKTNSSGMFYTAEMLPKYFPPEMALGLQQMIFDADHDKEVVVGLILGEKAVGLRLQKSDTSNAVEIVPPIVQ